MPSPLGDNAISSQLDAAYLDAMFDGARLGIIACNPAGEVISRNAVAVKLFPQLSDESAHVDVLELFRDAERETLSETFETCRTKRESAEFHWVADPDASNSPVFGVWCVPVVSDDGTLHGLSLWFRDISKRVRLQRDAESRKRLNVLGTLAGAVAHHYNNMLCSIATSLEFAANMRTTSAMRRALQRTADAVGRAGEVTQQLLAFAQADHREESYSDLTEAVLYYVDENEQRLAAQNVQLALDWQRIPICPIPREPIRIILENLVQNALEAMPDGGTLRIALAPRGSTHVAVSVIDSGDGIKPGALEHLFEPFFTTKGVLASGVGRNAGMGLAVVHGFVSEMGGRVSASNDSGGGAKFDIILPVPEARSADPS